MAVFYRGGLLYLLMKHSQSEKTIFVVSLLLFTVGTAMSDLVNFLCSHPVAALIRNRIVRTFTSGRIFTASLYLFLEGWLSQRKILLFGKASVGVMVAAFLVGMANCPSSRVTAIETVGIFCLEHSVSLKPRPVWGWFNRASKINYYWHMMFLFLYTLCFREFPYYGWDAFLAAAGCCLAISLLPAAKKKGKDV